MSIRRNHQNSNLVSKAKARLARIRERAIQMREQVKASFSAMMHRREAKLAWWQRAFRTPMVACNWVFSKVSALWVAFLG